MELCWTCMLAIRPMPWACCTGRYSNSDQGWATSEAESVRSMHNNDLPGKQGTDLIVIPTVVIAVIDLVYPYTLHTNDEVSAALHDTFSSRL